MKFPFNDGQITARELQQTITAYTVGAIQTALESGCQSTPQVMDFLARRDARQQASNVASGRKARALRRDRAVLS